MRPISTDGFRKPDQTDPGPAPSLQWIAIADLVVDEAYQRPIIGAGKTNVNRIASAFSWSKFAPVIVSPVEGGRYAVIDGQHRTTAAAVVGVKHVPCQVILADKEGQAAAFRAINGAVTRMSTLTIWKASLAAGDEQCLRIDAAARAAGVTVLGYPVARDQQKPGMTMAVKAIESAFRKYGAERFTKGLRYVTQTSLNTPGALGPDIIAAVCELATYAPPPQKAFDGVSIEQVRELAAEIQTRRGELPVPALVAAMRQLSTRAAA